MFIVCKIKIEEKIHYLDITSGIFMVVWETDIIISETHTIPRDS